MLRTLAHTRCSLMFNIIFINFLCYLLWNSKQCRLTLDDMLAIHDAVMIHFETPTMFAKQLDAIRETG